MRQARYRYILLPLFLVLACAVVFAQANSELTGIVTDQTGAVVSGAKITLTDPGTNSVKTADSGATGLYDFSGLNPGTYNLKVAAKGFENYAETGVVINVSQTFRHDVKLTVGADTQTVTVEADALAVQTDSNVVSTLISSEQISEIATENRNFAALAALGLGVSSALPDSNTPTSVASNFTISVNGLRQSHNIWLIDGGEADDRGGAGGMDIMPSQDAIAEFNMLTSNYPPDYGISSGATISLSLKSGTQKLHGEAYEFNRNSAYDAKQPITQSLTHIRYNIFGGNAGGPIFIPKVYNTNKQKSFFFWNEEWRRLITGAGTTNVPTLADVDRPTAGSDLTYHAPAFASGTSIVVPSLGDPAFNAMLTQLDLTPGSAFPGNKIPHQLFDPNAVLYLSTPVVPHETPGTGGKAQANVSNPIDVTDTVVRIDHKFNDKWQILGHYMEDKVTQGYASPHLGWLWYSFNSVTSNLSNPSDSAAIKISGTINPNLLVEGSINYDGNVINITNSPNSFTPDGWSVQPYFNLGTMLQGATIGQKSLPGMSWNAPYWVAEDLGSDPWHNAARDYEPKVDVSYTQGKHSEKFGFSYNRYTKNQQLFGDTEGNFGFGAAKTGDAFMDMLLGISSGYSQYSALPIRHYVNQTPSVYAMDNWHVTPRLSLQLGIRYDALPHAWERSNAVSNFDPGLYVRGQAPTFNGDGSLDPNGPGFQKVGGTAFYLNGIGLAGVNSFPKGLTKNDYNTLQPRVGFSEDIFGNGKTVLRGGFGTFYERMQGNDIYNAATTPPFAFNPSSSNVYFTTPKTSWVSGLTAATPTYPSSVTNIAHTYKAPAVAQFSLGVQHELKPSMIWVIQYVGNLAWHQNVTRNLNNYPLGFIGTTSEVTDPNGKKYVANNSARAGDGNCNHDGNITIEVKGKPAKFCTHPTFSVPDEYRTYPGFTGINQEENTTNGNYNGFQTGLRVQNKWGLSGELDYTYSHEIDLTTYDLSGVSNPYNLKYDKGSGGLDRRHIINANYVYKLPFFSKSQGLVKSIAGGWEVAGTFVDETGTIPANSGPGVSMSYDSIGLDGGYTNRPNVRGHVHYTKKYDPASNQNEWFDTSAFTYPTPVWDGGQNLGFGNARKDAIVGPSRVNFTTSIYKSFALTERMHFELRAESFNTFNHLQKNNVNTTLGNSQFGQVTSTWDPRALELGGKFIF